VARQGLLSRHDGGVAAEARFFGRSFKRIDDGRWQAVSAKSGGVEGECREVVETEVAGLSVGRIGLNQAGIVDSAAKENDRVAKGMTLNLVGVQVNALAGGELRNEDEGLKCEALVVGRVLVARHLLRKGAVGVDLSDGLLVGFDAEAEERIVGGSNPGGGCGESAPVVVIVAGISRFLKRDVLVGGGVEPGGDALLLDGV
jgi:hypothetical protein